MLLCLGPDAASQVSLQSQTAMHFETRVWSSVETEMTVQPVLAFAPLCVAISNFSHSYLFSHLHCAMMQC